MKRTQSFAHDASWQLISGLSAAVAQSSCLGLFVFDIQNQFSMVEAPGIARLDALMSLVCLPLQVIFCSSQKVNQYLAVTGCRQIAKSQQAKQASCACKETSEVSEVP